jgi:hypothetical protein
VQGNLCSIETLSELTTLLSFKCVQKAGQFSLSVDLESENCYLQEAVAKIRRRNHGNVFR